MEDSTLEVSARRRLELRGYFDEQCDGSDFLLTVEQLKRSGIFQVVLSCRESGWYQCLKGNLRDQRNDLRSNAEAAGLTVVASYSEEAHAHEVSEWDRPGLVAAAMKARELGVAVLAESRTRIVRNPLDRDGLPTRKQFEAIREITGWVPIATFVPPDATPSDERSHQTKRGQRQKGRKGGRPPKDGHKKRSRQRLKPQAIELRKNGFSIGAIATKLGRKKSTIQYWLLDLG